MYSISIFLFYILLIWGGGAYAPNAPPYPRACKCLANNQITQIQIRLLAYITATTTTTV